MVNKHWSETFFSHIWIFNVGRGLSIFIRTGLNQGIIYDFGSSDEFSPTNFIKDNILKHLDYYEEDEEDKKKKIAQAVISHPHLDHISEIEVLKNNSPFNPYYLTCPHDKDKGSEENEKIDWDRIKKTNPEGFDEKMGLYKSLYEKRKLPLRTIRYYSSISVPNLEYGIYYIRPPIVDELFPKDDPKYANATSLVVFFRYGLHTLLIPGDMPPEPMKYLLEERDGCEKRYTIFSKKDTAAHPEWHEKTCDQPSLKSLLEEHGLSILIAPHHGLESGYSEELYECIKDGKPSLVVISEKRHLSSTDGNVSNKYQSDEGASGLYVEIEGEVHRRNSVSTRNGHHILIEFPGTGGDPKIYAEKDPELLL